MRIARHETDRARVARLAAAWLRSPRTVILDTETTDLDGYLVQIAVVDSSGAVLFDSLIDPQAPISQGARAVHQIDPSRLLGAPTFAQVEGELASVLCGRRIVTYNAPFDSKILQNELYRIHGPSREPPLRAAMQHAAWRAQCEAANRTMARWIRPGRWRCAMDAYAAWVGEWNPRFRSYRWQRLEGGDHSALGDAHACLAVLRRMAGVE